MWGYNTHPRSLEDNQGLKVNYLSHQEGRGPETYWRHHEVQVDPHRRYGGHPDNIEDGSANPQEDWKPLRIRRRELNVRLQHTSSKFRGQPRPEG